MNHEDFLKQAAEAKTRIKEIASDEVERIAHQPEAFILDVREESEYSQGHLPDAKNISLNTLKQKIDEIAPDLSTIIVCYCTAGNRGALAADLLNSMGYANAVSIEGGLKAWESSGRDIIVD